MTKLSVNNFDFQFLNFPISVIYHANCADGFSAAWAAHNYFMNMGDIEFFIDFRAAHYNTPFPNLANNSIIFIVDFSYPKDVIIEAAKTAKHIFIIDHHKTAEQNLAGELPENVTFIYDVSKAGCILTWKFFNPTEECPELMQHIGNRDIWDFSLPYTREITSAAFSYEQTFENWYYLMNASTYHLVAQGAAILRAHDNNVKKLTKQLNLFKFQDYIIPVANVGVPFISDVGNELARDYPFAMTYFDLPTKRVFSLRSNKETGIDVSEIAKKFSGGGHKNAAGFIIEGNFLAGHACIDMMEYIKTIDNINSVF